MKHKVTFAARNLNIHQHIIKGIQSQLFLNDYLVLPNFGGFVLKTQRSSYTGSGSSLMPPTKSLGFNVQLKQNDGILSQWLQKELKCSASDATGHLLDFSTFCNSVLQSKRRLSLAGIGFFYLDFENNICFEPAADTNFFTESFGLTAVQLPAIQQEAPKEKVIKLVDRTVSPDKDVVVKKNINLRRTAYLSVLALAISGILFFVVNTLNSNGTMYAGLFHVSSKAAYVPITYNDLNLVNAKASTHDFVADNNGIALFKLNDEKAVAVNVFDHEIKKTDAENMVGKYEIIFGCFKKIKNAKRLVAQLKKENIMATIKKQSYKGMHVVALSGINDKIEAVDALEAIQTNYPKAWLKVNN